jgi:hypothetical protein
MSGSGLKRFKGRQCESKCHIGHREKWSRVLRLAIGKRMASVKEAAVVEAEM